MVRTLSTMLELDTTAPEFDLPNFNGEPGRVRRADYLGRPLLVMFICNHCPYVKAVIDRIVRDTAELKTLGVNSVAIMSNDPTDYPEDSFDNMQRVARDMGFPFPYLLDASQQVAKDYGAVCTPDFFGYNASGELQYRGRLDASRKETAPADARRDLFEAMSQVADTGRGPADQVPSMGCSIKWRD